MIDWEKIAELAASILVASKSVGYTDSDDFQSETLQRCRRKTRLLFQELDKEGNEK